MTAVTTATAAGTGSSIATASGAGALATIRRGLRLTPELRRGLGLTLLLALVATAGRVVVPVAVQRTVDSGLLADGGPDVARVRTSVLLAAAGVLLTACAAYAMNVRLFRAAETGLSSLRTKAFRHVHDLSVLTQSTERRGALVSRVTGDVDTISTFLQWAGLMLLLSAGQLVVATALMAYYSWQLTVLVWAVFLPLFLLLRVFQRKVSAAYGVVRERVGLMLGAISESVVGAPTVRAYGVEARTAGRIDVAIDQHRRAATRAQRVVALSYSSGELVSGTANAAVVVAGVWLSVRGEISVGELLAFLFLVQLFVGPVQVGTEVLNEAQNAVAGWRRVLAVLDTPQDVPDPGDRGVELARRPAEVRLQNVSYAYPGGPTVVRDVDVTLAAGSRVAVVGETGSGKTTVAKLLVRLMDPVEGRVLLDGVDVRDVRFTSLRERVVMVPQDGFLFEGTLRDNIRYGRLEATDDDLLEALRALGLTTWLRGLARGLDTPVGQRGESLSAGERQLVALARAYVADADLLVLDEALSSIDPATEVVLQRALEGVARGRTAVSIAHRLSTAESADEVLVLDRGELVERGPHHELVAAGGVYSALHASWAAQQHGT